MVKRGMTVAEARQHLIGCADFARLRDLGHELRDGAVLTSMSETPFEMSFKCIRCTRTFWFENPQWRIGDRANWQFNHEAREDAENACIPLQPAIVATQLNRRSGILHP